MFRPVSQFLSTHNPFKVLTGKQFCSWALVNSVALAAIAYNRKPTFICGAIGCMIGSTFVITQVREEWYDEGVDGKYYDDESCTPIFVGAILGAGFFSLIFGNAIGSYLEDLASNNLSQI